MNDEELVKKTFELAWKDTLEKYKTNPTSQTVPCGYVLGGQPGAGKSFLNGLANEKCHKNIVIINGDDFRKYHPDYNEFQRRSLNLEKLISQKSFLVMNLEETSGYIQQEAEKP